MCNNFTVQIYNFIRRILILKGKVKKYTFFDFVQSNVGSWNILFAVYIPLKKETRFKGAAPYKSRAF